MCLCTCVCVSVYSCVHLSVCMCSLFLFVSKNDLPQFFLAYIPVTYIYIYVAGANSRHPRVAKIAGIILGVFALAVTASFLNIFLIVSVHFFF